MSMLKRAIEIAEQAHAGQVDNAGAPHIPHPLRVMLSLSAPAPRIAAVLPDVVEDGNEKGWTLERLREEGFDDEIIGAVEALTRRDGEDYLEFVRRAGRHPIARAVKIADLKDNMDRTRIPNPSAEDEARFERYRTALLCIQQMG